jgi:23S rRNA (cytidine2498-2'-O)-methyltransferase
MMICPGVVLVAAQKSESEPGSETRSQIASDPESAPPAARDPVFSRQHLPAAIPLEGPSVAKLAEAVYAAAAAALDQALATASADDPEAATHITLHLVLPPGAEPALGSRAGLLGREVAARFAARRRRAWRRFLPPEQAAAQWSRVGLVIQILMVERERIWLSVAVPRPLPGGGTDLAPWPGGAVWIPENRAPPSRAYRKLEEAFAWMGRAPGPSDLCVDLGAAPGGWTFVALERGARVVAVDRAPLEPPVSRHPRLRMLEGNAFTFDGRDLDQPVEVRRSPARVRADWLLSDVVCEPHRSLALIERWLTEGWCHHLVVTIKFKGSTGYGMLDEVRATLDRLGCSRQRIKHLQHNKNEVTVMASAR